jgi:hypothetical protein
VLSLGEMGGLGNTLVRSRRSGVQQISNS